MIAATYLNIETVERGRRCTYAHSWVEGIEWICPTCTVDGKLDCDVLRHILDLMVETSLTPYRVLSAPSAGVSNVREAKNVTLLVQNEELMRAKCDQGPLPGPIATKV